MERTMRTIAVVLALAARASTAAAQQDFSSIKLKAGQHARATEDGITLSGEVTAVAPDAIVIDGHRLQPGPGLKIERDRGHTGWKGMGIGGAIGAIGGITIVSGAFWGAVIGAGMDRYVQVYDSRDQPLVLPQLSLPLFPPAGGEDFSDLSLKPGDRVTLTQDQLSISSTVTDLNPSRLVVGARDFEPSPTLTIEKEGDPIWDGAALGFLFGAIAPHLVEEGCWMQSGLRCSMQSGLEFALVGAVIDALHKGHTTVYADGHRKMVTIRLKR